MKSALFDTNILVDAFNGYQEAYAEFLYWQNPVISVITLIELYAGVPGNAKHRIAGILAAGGFEIVQIDATIVSNAIRIRSASLRKLAKIALPDAIILATAQARGLTIVTRNRKDFRGPNVRIPYELETVTTTRVINVRTSPP